MIFSDWFSIHLEFNVLSLMLPSKLKTQTYTGDYWVKKQEGKREEVSKALT